MSLRERCIGAGAYAVLGDRGEWQGVITKDAQADARAILDAVLDVLEGSADEWADYPAQADPIVVAHREIIARKLVGVLRGNGE